MKKIFIIAATLLIPSLASAATLSLSPSSQSVNVGDTFTVTISLDTQGAQIDGVDLRYLNYNPSLVQIQSVTPGSLMPLTLANSNNASLGRITFSQVAAGGNKYQGSGVLATLSVKALAAGAANVTFNYTSGNTTDSNVASAGTDVLNAVVNGSYTISAPSGGGAGGSTGGSSGGGGSSGSSSGGGVFSPGGGNSFAYGGSGGAGCAPGLAIAQITSVVGPGSKGDNVLNLQKFLVEKRYLTSDNVTGFFGPMTLSALQRFQAAEGIVSSGDPLSTGYGNAGPSTRTRINSLISTSVPSSCSGGTASSLDPATVAAIKAQILVLQQQVLQLLVKLQALMQAGGR